MEYVESPVAGYRLLPQYTHLISDTPSDGGRILTDPNGRPSQNILSALYMGCGPKYARAASECERMEQYPGRLTMTTFSHDIDYHQLLEQMRREDRQD